MSLFVEQSLAWLGLLKVFIYIVAQFEVYATQVNNFNYGNFDAKRHFF